MISANRLSIRLPEGVEFSLRLAGPITRFLAWFIDAICVSTLATIIATFIGLFQLVSRDFGGAMAILTYFIVSMGYPITLEWAWRGQTIGKRLLKLRVMDAGGMQLHFGQIVIRNLLRFADMMPALYMLGGAFCLVSSKSQRLGDLAAGTIVVRKTEAQRPELETLMQGKFNSLRSHPHLAARLRNKIEPAQAAVLLQILVRRDELTPASRVKIFAQAAAELNKLVSFPPEITEGLSDEAHVRNAVDILYRPRVQSKREESAVVA